MALNMGNITDDKIELLLSFVRNIARMLKYHDEMPEYPDGDAEETMNELIEDARGILSNVNKED